MRDVRCPPKPLMMRDAVGPVTAEVKEYIARQECPPVQFHAPWNKVVNPNQHIEKNQFNGCANDYVADTNENRPDSFFFFVIVFMLKV
jgi:hypothetical protein